MCWWKNNWMTIFWRFDPSQMMSCKACIPGVLHQWYWGAIFFPSLRVQTTPFGKCDGRLSLTLRTQEFHYLKRSALKMHPPFPNKKTTEKASRGLCMTSFIGIPVNVVLVLFNVPNQPSKWTTPSKKSPGIQTVRCPHKPFVPDNCLWHGSRRCQVPSWPLESGCHRGIDSFSTVWGLLGSWESKWPGPPVYAHVYHQKTRPEYSAWIRGWWWLIIPQ